MTHSHIHDTKAFGTSIIFHTNVLCKRLILQQTLFVTVYCTPLTKFDTEMSAKMQQSNEIFFQNFLTGNDIKSQMKSKKTISIQKC